MPGFAQTTDTNRALELDGRTAYVELPPNIFGDLREATIEAWIKWRSFPTSGTSRFFSYGQENYDTGIQATLNGELNYFLSGGPGGAKDVTVPGAIQTNEWYHLAAVSGPDGMKLFLNGAVIGTNAYPGSFAAIASTNVMGARFRFGRSVVDREAFVDALLDEVRVWKVARTDAQIRDTMFRKLNGTEPDLAGRWNFDGGTANDASPGAHHGTLVGAAKPVVASLPSASELVPWARLTGKLSDTAGTAVVGAQVFAELNGVELARATTDPGGDYFLTVRTRAASVDLRASAPNDLVAPRTTAAITPHQLTTANLTLKPALHVAGKVVALDGKMPHVRLVVELVRPAGSEAGFVSGSALRPSVEAVRSPGGNRVLRLEKALSYVELPPRVFEHLDEATIEAWVKWDQNTISLPFNYGDFPPPRWVALGTGPPPGGARDLVFSIVTPDGHVHFVSLPGGIRAGAWSHLAAATSPGGMKLYLNGELVASNADPVAFSAARNGRFLRLGRFTESSEPSSEDEGLEGEMDEVRVWSRERTVAEIRDHMLTRLTGNESGLAALWNFDDPAGPARDARRIASTANSSVKRSSS